MHLVLFSVYIVLLCTYQETEKDQTQRKLNLNEGAMQLANGASFRRLVGYFI